MVSANIVEAAIGIVHAFQWLQEKERAGRKTNPLLIFPSSFAKEGWDSGQGCPYVVEVTDEFARVIGFENKAALQEAAIDERKATVAAYSLMKGELNLGLIQGKEVKVPWAALAEIGRQVWCTDKGAWIKITYVANSGYGRLSATCACVLAYQLVHGNDAIYKLPLKMRHWESLEAMRYDRFLENAQPGREPYSPTDMLAGAMACVADGKSEAEVGRFFNLPRGASQKLHRWACLANKYPDLKIQERTTLPAPTDEKGNRVEPLVYRKGGYVPIARLDKELAAGLLGKATKPDSIHEIAKKVGIVRINEMATEKQVEEAIALTFIEKVRSKVMDRPTIQTFLDQCSVDALGKVFKGIINNTGPLVQEGMSEITTTMNA